MHAGSGQSPERHEPTVATQRPEDATDPPPQSCEALVCNAYAVSEFAR
jgi:hypothetical protein